MLMETLQVQTTDRSGPDLGVGTKGTKFPRDAIGVRWRWFYKWPRFMYQTLLGYQKKDRTQVIWEEWSPSFPTQLQMSLLGHM